MWQKIGLRIPLPVPARRAGNTKKLNGLIRVDTQLADLRFIRDISTVIALWRIICYNSPHTIYEGIVKRRLKFFAEFIDKSVHYNGDGVLFLDFE